MFLSAFRTAALRAGHRVRPMSIVRRSFNANSMFLGGSTAMGALVASSLASTTLCEKAQVEEVKEVKEETRIVANSLHLNDLPDTKIRIFYPIFVDSWYQFFCRILSSMVGFGGFFWHYELIDTINDMRIDGRRLKYTGDQMELVMLQLYENALTIVTLGFRRFLGYTTRAYGRYIDEHLEFRD